MNKRERVLAASRGEEVDRVPVSFWLHNFTREGTAQELADETIRLYDKFDWDFLKPQSRPYCFSEMFGLRFEPSKARAVWPVVTHFPVQSPEQFAQLKPADPSTGALGEQLEALQLVRDHVGPSVPIVATIFSPVMVAAHYLPQGMADVVRFMKEAPAQFEKGLAVISETLANYAGLCAARGLDGIFYATTVATKRTMTPELFARFQRPFDLPILARAAGCPLNIMHMCGDDILFDEFLNYPPAIFSWATGGPNPTLMEGHKRSGRAVLGGLPGKPAFGELSREDLQRLAREAIEEMGGRFHLLGPGCSINPDTSEDRMEGAGKVAQNWPKVLDRKNKVVW